MSHQVTELDLSESSTRSSVIGMLTKAFSEDPAWKNFYLDGTGRMFAAYATLEVSALSDVGAQCHAVLDIPSGQILSVIVASGPGKSVKSSPNFPSHQRKYELCLNDYMKKYDSELNNSVQMQSGPTWSHSRAEELMARSIEVDWLATAAEHRGKGFARHLLDLVSQGSDLDQELAVGSTGLNHRAFYTHLGFHVIRTLTGSDDFGDRLVVEIFFRPSTDKEGTGRAEEAVFTPEDVPQQID